MMIAIKIIGKIFKVYVCLTILAWSIFGIGMYIDNVYYFADHKGYSKNLPWKTLEFLTDKSFSGIKRYFKDIAECIKDLF